MGEEKSQDGFKTPGVVGWWTLPNLSPVWCGDDQPPGRKHIEDVRPGGKSCGCGDKMNSRAEWTRHGHETLGPALSHLSSPLLGMVCGRQASSGLFPMPQQRLWKLGTGGQAPVVMYNMKPSPLVHAQSLKIFKVKKMLEGKMAQVITAALWGCSNRGNIILLP